MERFRGVGSGNNLENGRREIQARGFWIEGTGENLTESYLEVSERALKLKNEDQVLDSFRRAVLKRITDVRALKRIPGECSEAQEQRFW